MSSKICNRCGLEKKESDFSQSDFLKRGGWCRSCNKEYKKEYYQKNKEEISQQNKEHYESNKTEILARNKQYRERTKEARNEYARNYRIANKEATKEAQRKWREENAEYLVEVKAAWYQKNKDIIKAREHERYLNNKEYAVKIAREYEKQKMLSDPTFKLRKSISRSIRLAIKNINGKNGKSIMNYLPYEIEELKEHLEKQFEPWMNWENWGVYKADTWKDNDQSTWTWQIDHITPRCALLFATMEEENFKKCWALENLRPLSAKRNLSDGAKEFKSKTRKKRK